MNVKLLRKVKKHILAEPRRFVMWTWKSTKEDNIERRNTFTSDASDNRQVKFAKCGTAACIAGWACILSKKEEPADFRVTAQRLLKIGYRDGESLFSVDSWPDEFRKAYQKSVTQPALVKIADARIEHFIKTGK